MARLARSVVAGFPHHVVQRGNAGSRVFRSDEDYRRYLDWLRHYAAVYGVDIWAYCLMPDHVHWICVPQAPEALARACNTIHMRYAQYYRSGNSFKGRLWRPRFMSCALDRPSAREEVRFVENNPVRAGLVAAAGDYRWSSARAHIERKPDPNLSPRCFLLDEVTDWSAYLAEMGEERLIGRTRARLRTGRPAGDPPFIRELEMITGRRLEALPRGRPRKRQDLGVLPSSGQKSYLIKRLP